MAAQWSHGMLLGRHARAAIRAHQEHRAPVLHREEARHATVLQLLGFDHTRLTYRFQGRDFRLTDVHGDLVTRLLA
jgi:hypothetical protein